MLSSSIKPTPRFCGFDKPTNLEKLTKLTRIGKDKQPSVYLFTYQREERKGKTIEKLVGVEKVQILSVTGHQGKTVNGKSVPKEGVGKDFVDLVTFKRSSKINPLAQPEAILYGCYYNNTDGRGTSLNITDETDAEGKKRQTRINFSPINEVTNMIARDFKQPPQQRHWLLRWLP